MFSAYKDVQHMSMRHVALGPPQAWNLRESYGAVLNLLLSRHHVSTQWR